MRAAASHTERWKGVPVGSQATVKAVRFPARYSMTSVAHRFVAALARFSPARRASPSTTAVMAPPAAPMVTGPKAVG